jgi:hypothetical protein
MPSKYSSQQCLLSPSQPKIGQRQRTDSPNRLTWLGAPALLIILRFLTLVSIYGSTPEKERTTRERTELAQHSVHWAHTHRRIVVTSSKSSWVWQFILHYAYYLSRGKGGGGRPQSYRSTGIAEISYLLQEGAGVRCRQQLTGSPQPDTGTEAALK